MALRRTTPILVLLVLGLLLAACGKETTQAGGEAAVTVEQIEGSELHRITLSSNAARRLAIETATVDEQTVNGGRQKVVPHAAVVWDRTGQAWTYTASEPLVFVRAPVTVERIDGDTAVLADGPDLGTPVVVVGAAELWGAETGVGGGH